VKIIDGGDRSEDRAGLRARGNQRLRQVSADGDVPRAPDDVN